MSKLQHICVFCGSSDGNDATITDAAISLGKTLASKNISLVYGAAKIGVMGTIAKTVLEEHGQVIGIIPEFLKKKEVVHLGLSELVTVESMHDRKLMMQQRSDGFITLPGGLGTLEELFEIITWLQLGLHAKPIGLLNVNGFYDPLLAQLEQMVKTGFIAMETYELLLVDASVEGLLAKMEHFKPPRQPNWLNEERT